MNERITRDRAEEPLLDQAPGRIFEQSAGLYLQSLLDRTRESDEELMFVYILASKSGTLYVGVSNSLNQRMPEHQQKLLRGFSSKYACTKLVYFEVFYTASEAIEREKQIKRWRREKKERLIRSLNPGWIDLTVYLPPATYRRMQERSVAFTRRGSSARSREARRH